MKKNGAYVLCINIEAPLALDVGALGPIHLPAGRYAYVGSARSGVAARVARHTRLAEQKAGKVHWHIDYLLLDPHVRLEHAMQLENGIECRISRRIASMQAVSAPVSGFGASDCRSHCPAHFYLLPRAMSLKDFIQRLESAGVPRTQNHRRAHIRQGQK